MNSIVLDYTEYTNHMDNIKPVLKAWLASSQNPAEISNTVKGAVLTASAFIVFFAGHLLGVTLTVTDVTSIATELGGLAGAIWFFYGLLFKGVVYAGTKKPVSPTL